MIVPGVLVDAIPPMNSGGRVNGIETKVSVSRLVFGLPKSVVVVKPTGSVVTVTWALAKVAAPKRRATKLALDRADGLSMRTEKSA